MMAELPHERLDVYALYLETASLCSDISSGATRPIVALDHLDRAIESIGVNLVRANGQPLGSASRADCLDVSIASTHECAAALDVCLVWDVVEKDIYTVGTHRLWRIRGMLLGLKRASMSQVREDSVPYGMVRFPFADLDMYQVALQGVRWVHDLQKERTLKARLRRRLDTTTTGTVLNIAEGHGRATVVDQNRFMKIAQDHAYQTLVLLDLMASRSEVSESCIASGKAMVVRAVTMLHAWCGRERQSPLLGCHDPATTAAGP